MTDDFVHPESPFCSNTFDILDEWNSFTRQNEILAHQDFIKYVIEPCTLVLAKVKDSLSPIVKSVLNKSENFNRLVISNRTSDCREDSSRSENFYWLGLYPSKYISVKSFSNNYHRPQLFISISKDLLDFGFYMGLRDAESMKLLFQNFEINQIELGNLMKDTLPQGKMVYGFWEKIGQSNYTFEEFLKNPRQVGESTIGYYSIVFYAAVHIEKIEVLRSTTENIVSQIVNTFEALFPLVVLAIDGKRPMPFIRQYLKHAPKDPLLKLIEIIGFDKVNVASWIAAIKSKSQAILYGSPGTGKTFIAEKLAQYLIGNSDGFFEIVQFHPAYTYEDFIQGIRPQSQDGQLKYSLVPGRFLEFCQKAETCKGTCVLIIDEINRANLSQVFGELMYLLEYRDRKIPLAAGNTFRIPANVLIIGTMNTADRSIALVDHALRRRFAFIEIRPNYDVLRKWHEKNTGFSVDGLIETLKQLNQAIADKNYEIGISFFLKQKLAEKLEYIWRMEIEPYLEEYFFNQIDKVEEFRWDNIKQKVSP